MEKSVALPKKLTPDPIIEAIVEIRFIPEAPVSAVFGSVFGAIKDLTIGPVTDLPLSQIPEFIRENDNNLKFKPLYQLQLGKFVGLIGPRVLAIASKEPYVGWKEFYLMIETVFSRILALGIIKLIPRIGIRYINFFKENILEATEIKLLVGNKPFEAKETLIKCLKIDGDIKHTIQILGPAIAPEFNEKGEGWILDIDTYFEGQLDPDLSKVSSLISRCHELEKTQFFHHLGANLFHKYKPDFD